MLLSLTADQVNSDTYSIWGRRILFDDENDNGNVDSTSSTCYDEHLGTLVKTKPTTTDSIKNLGSYLLSFASPNGDTRIPEIGREDATHVSLPLTGTSLASQNCVHYSLYSTAMDPASAPPTMERNRSFWRRACPQRREQCSVQSDSELVASILYEEPSFWEIVQHGVPPRRAFLGIPLPLSTSDMIHGSGKDDKSTVVFETKEPYRLSSSWSLLPTSKAGAYSFGLNSHGRGRYPSCKNIQLRNPSTMWRLKNTPQRGDDDVSLQMVKWESNQFHVDFK